MCIVLAREACEGPNTQDQARRLMAAPSVLQFRHFRAPAFGQRQSHATRVTPHGTVMFELAFLVKPARCYSSLHVHHFVYQAIPSFLVQSWDSDMSANVVL